LYREEPFSGAKAVESETAVLVFRKTSNDAATCNAGELPTDSEHISRACGRSTSMNMMEHIQALAQESLGDGVSCPDQCNLEQVEYGEVFASCE